MRVPAPKPALVTATRTVRLRVAPPADAGQAQAMEETLRAWLGAVRFYTDLFLGHPGVYTVKNLVTSADGQGTRGSLDIEGAAHLG